MRNGIVFSSVLHVALVALLVYGLPDSAPERSLGGTPVPVIFENPLKDNVTAAVTPRSEPVAPTEAPPDATPPLENTTEPAQPAAPNEALPDPAAAPAPEGALSETPEGTTVESLEQPELPEGASAGAVFSPVPQKVAIPDDEPVEEVAPEPLVAPETSLALTEKPELLPPREDPAPRVASEDAPPVLQSAPSPLSNSGVQAPPTPIATETPEQLRQPEAEVPEEPVVQAPSTARPGPEVLTPEEIRTPPPAQVASVAEPIAAPTPPAPQEAAAPGPALAVPRKKPARDVSLPKEEPPKQQQTERKPEPESEPQQNSASPSAAGELIARIAGDGASQQEPEPESEPQQNSAGPSAAGELIARIAGDGASQQKPALAGGSAGKLSRAEEDRVRKAISEAISRHWNVDCGALGIRDMVVEIRFQIEPDRTVSGFEILGAGGYRGGPAFRSAVEAAVRAVRRTGPLPLPADGYDQWNRLKLNFRPNEFCG